MTTAPSLVFRNARIVDGTGSAARLGDVALRGDRITAVGLVPEKGTREIDAQGMVLAPGFIDIHTHYDPQLCWDRLATPSPAHGVTTVVMGNCSISLAPVRAAGRAKLISLFGSVEDMESSLLERTIPFEWESVPQYLDHLRQGLGPNVAMLVGHAVLRLYVMGDAAQQRAATDAELAQMCDVLEQALRTGAKGLSFSFAHLDESGQPLPCHFADTREKLALLQVISNVGHGVVEVAPNLMNHKLSLQHVDEWGALALQTGVLCSLSPLLHSPARPDIWRSLLDRFEHWQALGAPLMAQTQVRPLDFTVRLSQGSALLSKFPTWRRFLDLPVSERLTMARDAAFRTALDGELNASSPMAKTFAVKRVMSSVNQEFVGQRLTDIAEQTGQRFVDVLFNIALADELETEFAQQGLAHTDVATVAHLLGHPGVHIGSADSGAHITQFSGAGDTGYLLHHFVRERGQMSLERAVQRLTSDLSKAWGFTDRGLIQEGHFADLVLFNPATIGRGEEEWADDVPGGSGRYTRAAFGIELVVVNGQVLVERGQYSAARPGRVV